MSQKLARKSLVLMSLLMSFLGATLSTQTSDAEEVKVKDGRQYVLELSQRLEIPQKEILKDFQDLRQNLPKNESISSLVSGLDSMAKLANAACTYAGLFEQDWKDVDGLYKSMFDRAPTNAERESIIKDKDGNPSFYSNCFVLAMSPEFFVQK